MIVHRVEYPGGTRYGYAVPWDDGTTWPEARVASTAVTLERFDAVAVEGPEGTRQLKPRAQSTDLWGAEYAFRIWT